MYVQLGPYVRPARDHRNERSYHHQRSAHPGPAGGVPSHLFPRIPRDDDDENCSREIRVYIGVQTQSPSLEKLTYRDNNIAPPKMARLQIRGFHQLSTV